ncbi:MAG TPA: helix-turn-helix transcriptional regulator, partial [Vicinamibacterales bacterium]|nr:helix-turn-helix transcriptional regulator [Vicinamibacterales bacterium]
RQGAGRPGTLGAIYSALDRAQRKGLVTSELSDPVPVPGGRRRRHYRLTARGEDALRKTRNVRESLWQPARGATK